MDLSKLPKLSQTPATPPPEPPAAADAPQLEMQVPAGAGEIWLSAIVGMIFIIFGQAFLMFLIAKLTGQTFHTNVTWQTGENAGTEVAFYDLEGFTGFTSTASFLFGLALIFDAIALGVTRRSPRAWVIALALSVMIVAAVFNLWLVFKLFAAGITPLLSLLAVAFGVYIGLYQWQLFKLSRAAKAR